MRKLKAHECRAGKVDHIKYQPNSAPRPTLPGLGKERFRRALQGKAAVALETWNRSDIAETTASWNSGIYANLCQVETSQNFIVKQDQQDGPQGNWSWLVHKIFPLDLQLESTILDFHGERTQNRYL